MAETKEFHWERNPNVDGYTEHYGEFIPLEISAAELSSKTRPSTSSAGREQAALRHLQDYTEVYTPILVWQPTGEEEEDAANDIAYLDGRHTVDALARNFEGATVTALVPRVHYRKIAELLGLPAPG
jgi:hypothetical protein